MMDDQLEKYSINDVLLFKDKFNIKKEESEETDSIDNKIEISETTLIIGSGKLENHDGRKQYEISNDVGKELLSCKMEDNIPNYNITTEKEIITNTIKMEFESALYCGHCHVYYEDYCKRCEMLVHILNKNASNDTIELPDNILEIQNSFEQFGIFASKVIPKRVTFGPFTGFSNTECLWKRKEGKFVLNKDETKYLNWMKYINHARSSVEQNLFAFACDNKLYYQSICEIQVGDELLVHFGEEYEDSLNKVLEVDSFPRGGHISQDVFACTFCCLGFSSISNLVEHKKMCFNSVDGRFPDGELMQCSFCKIYLYRKEYFEHHMTYCSEKNDRKCLQLPMCHQTTEVGGRRTQRRRLYKCAQCEYRTKYKGDLKTHANHHFEVKMYKCGICYRRFTTKDSRALHIENSHIYVDEKDLEPSARAQLTEGQPLSQSHKKRFKCYLCDFRATYKIVVKTHIKTKHFKEFDYKCQSCDYKTNHRFHLERHIKAKHLREFDYKCESCNYKTSQKSCLKRHVKEKHLDEFDYKCQSCDYKTNHRVHLERHIKSKHLKEFDYKCESCNYKTSQKSWLKKHVKEKHLDEFDYKCQYCGYKTNDGSYLERHIKSKHLEEFDYKCELCDYKTSHKSCLKKHIKAKHLKELDYKCELCDYKTNKKSRLKKHVKEEHLDEFDYKCQYCGYKTNDGSHFEKHIKSNHLKEFDYKCESCGYKTNYKSNFEMHMKRKHLKEFG